MARTPRLNALSGEQILDGSVGRQDLCDNIHGKSVIKKISSANDSIYISSTGIDKGTGDVTISTKTFIWDQQIPTVSCLINHDLNKFPSIIIADSAGTKVEPEISYVNENSILVMFSSPFAFKAYLN